MKWDPRLNILWRIANNNNNNQSVTILILPPRFLSQVQTVVWNTCSIVREFLNDQVHLSDEEANNP
jgi:hypothetical protein